MTTEPTSTRDTKKRMPKTVRPKKVVIDGKPYVKCPHSDCGYIIEDSAYNPKIGFRKTVLYSASDEVFDHVREVHKLVWMNAGKNAGWWPLVSFIQGQLLKKGESRRRKKKMKCRFCLFYVFTILQ